jgi:hypothetical protein
MRLASAYPNSALPAWSLLAIALVAAGTLAVWLALVYLAARQPHKPTALLPASRNAPGGERGKQSEGKRR